MAEQGIVFSFKKKLLGGGGYIARRCTSRPKRSSLFGFLLFLAMRQRSVAEKHGKEVKSTIGSDRFKLSLERWWSAQGHFSMLPQEWNPNESRSILITPNFS